MKPPLKHPLSFISQALISASNNSKPSGSWSRSLEQTLHKLHVRSSLTPALIAQIIDPHLLHYPFLSLGLFHWASQQPNFSHSSITYHSLLKSLSISRHFNALQKLLKDAKSRNIPVDHTFYRTFIASQIKMKRTHDAFLLLNDVGISNFDLGTDMWNSILAGLVSEGRFDCAYKVFDEMLVRNVSLGTLGFGLFMWGYCRRAQMGEILGVLDRVRKYVCGFDGSIVALLIVHGLCEVGRMSEAYGVLEELRNRGCKPDFMAYRIVAEGFRLKGSGCVFEVQMVLKKKRKLGVAPRSSDYKEFILALISENLLYEAKELGKIIVDGNFPIDDDLLNALIGSISKIDPCSAVLFFNFMVGKERMPTLYTLRDLSRNLHKHDKIDDLLEIFNTLSAMNYFTNLENYSVMFSSMCEAGRVREAYGVLQEMRKKGLNPDTSFYNVLMKALCCDDLLRPAKKLWDEMFACGIEGNLETYNILIKKFAESGQVDEAQLLFEHLLHKGLTPNASIYNSLLEGLCQDTKIEAAIQIFYKAFDQDIKIAQMMLNPLVLFLCKGGHFTSASGFLSSNCHLGQPESHAIFLKCLADAKEVQIAINHLKQVMAISPNLLQEISTEILGLLSSSSNPYPILELLREIQRNEYTSTDSNWKGFCMHLSTWV